MDKFVKIEAYFAEEHYYKSAIGMLRDLVLKTELEETYKWMFPTYTLAKKNVLAICKFKNHFGIWFFNGVFLSDPKKVLQNAQEGKTKAMRQWKFVSSDEIDEKTVISYIHEAIENQKNGKVIRPQEITKPTITSKLLIAELKKNKILKSKFESFSNYKKKEFHEYLATAKQETTKKKRLAKITPMIMDGIGLNDKYR